MKICDEALLAEFRAKRACEWCRQPSQSGLDPHHIHAKGMGGGGRLDVRLNLVSLCRGCHTLVHAGEVARYDLLAIVAFREGIGQDKIEAELARIRRLDKWGREPIRKGGAA